MEKTRVTLTVIAFCISIGGSIDSSTFLQIPVYEFMDLPGSENDQCKAIEFECSFGSHELAVLLIQSHPHLRSTNNIATQCGVALYLP
jgi:hypothetical protein